MTNRRDLLKFFGAGTLIAPLANENVVAKLIEPPKADIVLASNIPHFVDAEHVQSATVILAMRDGSTHSLNCNIETARGRINLDGGVRLYFEDLHTSPMHGAALYGTFKR